MSKTDRGAGGSPREQPKLEWCSLVRTALLGGVMSFGTVYFAADVALSTGEVELPASFAMKMALEFAIPTAAATGLALAVLEWRMWRHGRKLW